MAFQFHDLNDDTRVFVCDEIETDQRNGTLYYSHRLSERGRNDYPNLLLQAARFYDIAWLAEQIRSEGRLNAFEPRRTPKGGMTQARVPVNAHEMLAEGEFNRFYLRGLCQRAGSRLVIYRAKAVSVPRADSEAKIGTEIDARALLDDLRTNQGVDTALGLPPGPNSGLCARLVLLDVVAQ